MLALTKRTEYALIALTHLARHEGQPISAREISDEYHVPLPLLMNILKILTQRGLVSSVRGVRGGYRLAMPATDITLDSLIHAVEGLVTLTQCVAARDGVPRGTCEVGALCPVCKTIQRINDKLREFLRQITLADLSNGQIRIGTSPPPIAADA